MFHGCGQCGGMMNDGRPPWQLDGRAHPGPGRPMGEVIDHRPPSMVVDNRPQAMVVDNRHQALVIDNRPQAMVIDNRPQALVVDNRSQWTLNGAAHPGPGRPCGGGMVEQTNSNPANWMLNGRAHPGPGRPFAEGMVEPVLSEWALNRRAMQGGPCTMQGGPSTLYVDDGPPKKYTTRQLWKEPTSGVEDPEYPLHWRDEPWNQALFEFVNKPTAELEVLHDQVPFNNSGAAMRVGDVVIGMERVPSIGHAPNDDRISSRWDTNIPWETIHCWFFGLGIHFEQALQWDHCRPCGAYRFLAWLEKQENQSLGLHCSLCSRGLKVTKIGNSGNVMQWNNGCARSFLRNVIRKGDIIVAVNGIVNDAQMMSMLAASQPLRLQILRPGIDADRDLSPNLVAGAPDNRFHVLIDRKLFNLPSMGLGVDRSNGALLVDTITGDGCVAEYNRRILALPPEERVLANVIRAGDWLVNINGRTDQQMMSNLLLAPPPTHPRLHILVERRPATMLVRSQW